MNTSVQALIQKVEANGGRIWLASDGVYVSLPETLQPTLEELRAHKTEIMEFLLAQRPAPSPETMRQVELLPREIAVWDEILLAWTRVCCCFKDGCWSSVSSLYISHVEWAHQTGQRAAGDREMFRAILMALGFEIQGEQVHGLMLKADWQAAHWQLTPPQAKPAPKPRKKWGTS